MGDVIQFPFQRTKFYKELIKQPQSMDDLPMILDAEIEAWTLALAIALQLHPTVDS